jgi:uncharacterized protein (DUF924 family)
MAMELLTVSAFASKTFVHSAKATPMRPESVISFFFGVDYPTQKQVLQKGTPLQTMNGIWFGSNDNYDQLCQAFVQVTRAAGTNQLLGETWNASIDGKVSQMLLCDQLARNAFRGTEEAYRYDRVGLQLFMELSEQLLGKKSSDSTCTAALLQGEFYPPYVVFLVLPLMHSEALPHHELGLELLDWSLENFPKDLVATLEIHRTQLHGHTDVLRRFGRYPHRNAKQGRCNTVEETAWLADVENLPGWAKSQG